MNTQQAYDAWAAQYDTNRNRTRDLEAVALRSVLAGVPFTCCLEIGCGTGKNTVWLAERAHVTGLDLSEEMLAVARQKVTDATLIQADITQPWPVEAGFDLVTFSLVLEHIEELGPIFRRAAEVLAPGGLVYVGELHPFKQYQGTQARFDTAEGRVQVPCFQHHVSDFVRAAETAGLKLTVLEEWFDEGDRTGTPRILTMVFTR